MKTKLIAVAACLSLAGFAGGASAKILPQNSCTPSHKDFKNAGFCSGTPFAGAFLHVKNILCAYEWQETNMGASEKYMHDLSIKAFQEFNRICKANHAKLK